MAISTHLETARADHNRLSHMGRDLYGDSLKVPKSSGLHTQQLARIVYSLQTDEGRSY